MRAIFCLLSVLLAGCASRDGFIDDSTQQCEPGQPVSIQLGVDLPQGSRMEGMDDHLTIFVAVSNNSHQEITVTRVTIEQAFDHTAYYRIDSQSRTFNEVIPEGEEHAFELPTTGRLLVRPQELAQARPPVMGVRVRLASGDEYYCRYQLRDPS